MKRLLLAVLILLPSIGLAQHEIVILRGQIVDANKAEAIPYVNIRLDNFYYGTSTNLEGRFELKLKRDLFSSDHILKLSSIGYISQNINLSQIEPSQYQLFKLEPSSKQLNEVVIKSERAIRKETNQAKTLLMDAIDRIPSNKIRSKYLAKGFYRHYCKEDSTYVRLTEAAVSYNQIDGKANLVQIPEQRLGFDIRQMRRSFDFTAFAKLTHPPISLNFLLSNDLQNYEFHNPLRRNLDQYELSITDTTTFQENPVAIVEFEPKREGKLTYSGRIYINLNDKAFVRADYTEKQISTNKQVSIYSIVEKKVFYERIKNKYYPIRVLSDVSASHYSLTNPNIEAVKHESHVEMMVNEFIPKSKVRIDSNEPNEEDLREIDYDSTFWNNYNVLEATPLEQKIITDLSQRISLEKQFKSINELKKGVESLISSTECQNILANYEGIPTFIIFWAKWKVPNYYEILPSQQMRKLIKKGKLKLVMISLDEDEAKWELNKEIYGFEQQGIEHHRIDLGFGEEVTKSFYTALFPDFLFLDENGKITDHHPPLPNQDEWKDYFKNMIKDAL